MTSSNRDLRSVQSEETPPIKEELDAIHGEIIRTISLLRVLVRAVADMGEAELEESLKIAAEHLNGAQNRMDCALMRFSQDRA